MRLYWDPIENVPLLSRGRSDIDLVVPLSRVSDPRPATDWDLRLLRDTLDDQFGLGTYGDLVVNEEVVLLGRAPYLDTAYEVISDGVVLGHLFFDLLEFKWYFKPGAPSISRIGHRIERLEAEGRRGEVIGEARPDDPKFLLLRNGIAERIGDNYVVVKEFKSRREPIEVRTSWRKVVSINEPQVLSREFESIRIIWRVSKGRRVIVSFSGGKDSSVLLELVKRSGLEFLVYFNDTGLELPETLRLVERVGCDVLGSAGDSFWRNLTHFGPPARDYRWCCKVLKLTPTYRALKGLKPALTLVGQRKYESSARMRSPRLWENTWLPGMLTAAPMNDWSNLQTWLYISVRKVNVNPLYFEGFERLGCYLCPASRLSDFERLKVKYGYLWERWEEFLRSYASERGYDECWLRYGIWRWVDPPERMRRICEFGRRAPMRLSLDGASISVGDVDRTRLVKLSKTLRRSKLLGVVLSPDGRLRISFSGDPIEVMRLTARAKLCGNCGICSEYCESNAIKLDHGAEIDEELCSSCGKCNEVCPISAYALKLVEVQSH
ncbi:MAG: phosphoadenosine phosphosulfate reductase family protein [Candidatus Korarchaeum sp.]